MTQLSNTPSILFETQQGWKANRLPSAIGFGYATVAELSSLSFVSAYSLAT